MLGKKAAIIGFGSIAPMHTQSLAAIGAEITAVCDTSADRLRMAAADSIVGAAAANARLFSDYAEMLENGGFNVLHICLPHHLHAAVAIAALEKGIHVLCEKPLATTIADAEAMLAASQKSGAALGPVFQNRHSPGALLIKEALQSGALGAVKGGHLRVTWFRADSYYETSDWRGKIATEGGGVLINQSIHMFDLLNFFLGKPTAVSASIANRAHPKIEVEDMAEGIVDYGKTRVSFFVNTYHPYDAPAFIELFCEKGHAQLSGESATITFTNGRVKTAGPDEASRRRLGMKSHWGVSHIKLIKAFYTAIKEGRAPHPDGADGLGTQKLINGIYTAAREETRENGIYLA